jgi:hypothetical protein
LLEENNNLHNQVKKLKKSIKEYKKNDESEDEQEEYNDNISSEINNLKNALKELNHTCGKEDCKDQKLTDSNNNAFNELQEKYDKIVEENKDLFDENISLHMKIETLKTNQQHKTISSLKDQIIALKKQNKELVMMNDRLTKEMDTLKSCEKNTYTDTKIQCHTRLNYFKQTKINLEKIKNTNNVTPKTNKINKPVTTNDIRNKRNLMGFRAILENHKRQKEIEQEKKEHHTQEILSSEKHDKPQENHENEINNISKRKNHPVQKRLYVYSTTNEQIQNNNKTQIAKKNVSANVTRVKNNVRLRYVLMLKK